MRISSLRTVARRVAEPTISGRLLLRLRETLGVFRALLFRLGLCLLGGGVNGLYLLLTLSEHFADRLEQELLDDRKRDERIAHRHENLPPADADKSLVNCLLHRFTSFPNGSILRFVSMHSDALCRFCLHRSELADERVGKQQDQRNNERVNTGGLCHCDTKDHGTGDIALCLG